MKRRNRNNRQSISNY